MDPNLKKRNLPQKSALNNIYESITNLNPLPLTNYPKF